MSKPMRTIVVFEHRSRWEPELQRQFRDRSVRVRGCRTWSELSSVAFSPLADLLVLDLPEDLADCLQWLNKLIAPPSVPAVIVLCPSGLANLEWTLRDVGVREVLIGDVPGEQLARICSRMISNLELGMRKCE